MSIVDRLVAYGEIVEEIDMEKTRLYARRHTAYAASTANFSAAPSGGEPGDRVGNGATAITEIEAHIRELVAHAAIEFATIEETMVTLTAREKTVIRVRYFDRAGWDGVADVLGCTVRGAQYIHDRAIRKMEEKENGR